MTTTTQRPPGFFEQHHFLLRRLHSLSGILPIGLFLIFHLMTNASIVWGMVDAREGTDLRARGVRTFASEVSFIHSAPFLLLIEAFGLWFPIAFHALLGLYYAKSGRSNTAHYAWAANRRYALQRLSGYVGIVFIFYHVATLRWHWTFLMPGGVLWDSERAASTMAMILRGVTTSTADTGISLGGALVSTAYFISASLLVFHFANGLWTAAITWGLTVSAKAQRRWGFVCAGLGAALMLAAWASVIGFLTLNPAAARDAERSRAGANAPAMYLGDAR